MTLSILLGLALAAGAPEPVVWTKMADPDPTYVAPKAANPKRTPAKAGARRGADPDNLDGAIVNLMQAEIEVAAKIERDYEREVRRLEDLVERSERAAERGEAVEEPPQD